MSAESYRRETEDIKAALQARMADLAERLLPDGHREGGLWVSYNPRGDDLTKKPALKVRIRGGSLGAWSDWRNGDKGDVFGLICHCKGCDFKGARAFALDFLGWVKMDRATRDAMRVQAQNHARDREAEAAKERQAKIDNANRLWRKAEAGTCPARDHALAYLAARHCPLHAVTNPAHDTFRYSASTEWWKGATWEMQERRRIKTAPGPLLPAIHSAMRNRLGLLTACHVTFLDPVRPAKAAVEPPKLMLGPALGAVIELALGPENVPFWQAQEAHPLIICEGIETGLSLAVAIDGVRVWAAGSLSGIAAAPVDLACISRVIFARDNNHGNDQAQAGFDKALAALEAIGKRIDVIASPVGDDFNNLAQE